jgi:hypothetical protein
MPPPELLETNPVLVLEQHASSLEADPLRWSVGGGNLDTIVAALLRAGHGMPESSMRSWIRRGLLSEHVAAASPCTWRPGVVGLVYGQGEACVVPLEVEPSQSWKVAEQLPVDARRLTDLLVRVLAEARTLEPGVLPETRAFSIATSFPWPSSGTSMDVAATLAIFHRAGGAPECMQRACALVEPDGSRLRPVEGGRAKLAAFVRECGRGTLLVRHPACLESAAFVDEFEEVWSVASIRELAERLAPLGVFAPWQLDSAYGMHEAELILTRLRDLQRAEPDHEAIARLASRALECSWQDNVPPAVRHRPRLDLLRSLRHLGRYADALATGERWCHEIRELGDAGSLEQIAEADLEFAAGLFDPADFERMLELLAPWLGRIDADPVCLSPRLRCHIWNTAARAMVRLDRDGWDVLLRRSLDLQRRTDPSGLARTRNYLVEGLLRAQRLDEARREIELGEAAGPDSMSWAMLRFLRADLARRQSETWSDAEFDLALPRPGRANHPLGLYLQATARQCGRSGSDALRRFQAAAQCFEFDAQRSGGNNVLWVLYRSMQLAASILGGVAGTGAHAELVEAVSQPGLESLRARLGELPVKREELEAFLERLPWT